MKLKDVFELQLKDLLFFVKVSCHEGLHDTLNEVRDLSSGMGKSQLTSYVRNFITDIQRHLLEEENHLFPLIESDKDPAISQSIGQLVMDHDHMKNDLLKIRKMTHDYSPHLELDAKGISLYQKLKEMDRILLNHIQIENNILFPMILDRQ